MGQFWVRLIPVCLAGGCSLIYNPSNITVRPDAPKTIDGFMQADARIDTPIPMDADPTMLMIDSVYPGTVNEGAGDGGSRPALIVIHGKHMTSSATVQITGASTVSVASSQVSPDGDWMAVLVHAAVDMGTTTDTGTQPLTVSVTEPGAPAPSVLTGALVLQNLPQFPSGTSVATSALAPLYSVVNTGNITFTGDASHPAIVKAVSSITMGTVTVKGADASGSSAGAGGPGGCDGGGGGSAGGCVGYVGGGGGAGAGGGGGGGGNASDGAGGNGSNPGSAGTQHGNPQLVNLVVSSPMTTNQASGGGGGGSSLLSNVGAGGGGGGTLQLDAGGDIHVTSIVANGGKGGNGTGTVTSAGGGGGGAGGIVIVRSAHGTVSIAADASAGVGGSGTTVVSGGGGGAGALGRIRIDAPAGSLPTTTPMAHRGPMFATATPQIVTDVNPMVSLLGQPMDIVDGYDIDSTDHEHEGEPKNQTFASGTLQLVPAMLAGYNKLCFTLQPGVRRGDLADTCIEIAYLP